MTTMETALIQLYDINPQTAKTWLGVYETCVANVLHEHKTFDNEMDKLAFVTAVLDKKRIYADTMSDFLVRFVEHIARSNATFHGNGSTFDAIRAIQSGATYNVIILLQSAFTGNTWKRTQVQQYLRKLSRSLHTNFPVVSFLGWLWVDKATLKRIVESLSVKKQLMLLEDLRKDLGIHTPIPTDYSDILTNVQKLTGLKRQHLKVLLKRHKESMDALQGYMPIFW
jgi:hypothetical protein